MRLIFAYKEIVVSMVILVNGISNAFWIEQNATAVSVMTAVYVPMCFSIDTTFNDVYYVHQDGGGSSLE